MSPQWAYQLEVRDGGDVIVREGRERFAIDHGLAEMAVDVARNLFRASELLRSSALPMSDHL
jgi:hypothetical protein